MATVGSIPRITAPELRDLLLRQAETGSKDVAVIDVRDDDHIGGHIRTSTHVPSHTHDHSIPSLVRTHQNTPTLVFHCQLSQVRGPKAALAYLRTRERLLGSGPTLNVASAAGSATVGEALAKSAGEKQSSTRSAAAAAKFYSQNPERAVPPTKEMERALKEHAQEEKQKDKERDEGWEDVAEEAKKPKQQTVYVLVDGFQGWQYKYGEDERLTEAYSKELWSEADW